MKIHGFFCYLTALARTVY